MTLGPLMIDVQGTTLSEEDRDLLQHPLVGAVILFTRNFESIEQLERLVADIRAVRTPPLLVTVDHEGGRVQRFRKGFTVLPPMRTIGRQYDLDQAAGRQLARQCGWLMAAELRAVAIDMSFAPCVDLDYGVSSVIGDRAFHRDPQVVAELAIAFVGGMREAGMAATAKHFPGHGAVVPDSHVAIPVDRRALADLDEDLYPYRRLIVERPGRRHGRPRDLRGGRQPACRVFLTLDPAGAARKSGVRRGHFYRRSVDEGCGGRRRHGAARRSRPGGRLRCPLPLQRSSRCAASHRIFAGKRRSSEPGSDGAPARQARSDPGRAARFGGVAGLRGRGQGLLWSGPS